MLTSTAVVPTDAASRYAKQLLSHLGRKAGVEPVEGDPEAGLLRLSSGVGVVRPRADHLILEASAADDEALAAVEDVLAPAPRALRCPPRVDRHLAAGRRLSGRRGPPSAPGAHARLPGILRHGAPPGPAPSAW